ncbi:methyltransferase family protein [[Eubacterium] cellulosolvens]
MKSPREERRAIILVPIAVLVVIGTILFLGYLTTLLFRIPLRLGLSLPIRLSGAAVLTVAMVLWIWLFQHRRPADVLVSTYSTFSKLLRRVELKQDLGRTERLVVRGPYRLVRHPLYLAVLLSIVGWGLLLDLTFVLLAAPLALLWFNFVVMPYEERELVALFGRDYEEYMKRVRRLLPIPRSSRGSEEQEDGGS